MVTVLPKVKLGQSIAILPANLSFDWTVLSQVVAPVVAIEEPISLALRVAVSPALMLRWLEMVPAEDLSERGR